MDRQNKRTLTCIVCPRGCTLDIELKGTEVASVLGNLCKRGQKYAEDECTNPMRTVTTTVKTSDGGVVAVKTEGTIPKEQMLECMGLIANVTAVLPVKIGDIILDNVCGTRIIATQNKN